MQNLLIFIIGLFLIAALFRVDFFFYLLYVLFGVFFLSQIWTDRTLRGIECKREYTDRAFLGERVPVKLHLRNKNLLPVGWLRIHESLPIQLRSPNFFNHVLSLLPKEKVVLHYELDCRRRGYYLLGPLVLSSGDLFGIHTRDTEIPSNDFLTVYPQIVPLAKLDLPAQTPFGSIPTKQRIFEDPARMIGVRDYQSGDSLRHIHWKTTASKGVLQVKRFEPAISIESQILLNLNRSEYSLSRVDTATELAIVVAASIANYLIEKKQTVGLCCNGWDLLSPEPQLITLPPRKGREQLMNILEVLARVRTADQFPFSDLLRQAKLHLTWGGTAIIITGHADEALFENMLLMKRGGFHVMLILVDPQTPFVTIKERAKEVGIRAYMIWQESDLDVWR
jgi:uncharacterized protein (DUF58 family)